MSTEQKIRRIVAEHLDMHESEVKPEHNIIGLGADSLGLIEMLLDAEETFEIDITDDDVAHVRTVADAIAYVEKSIAAQ